MNMWAATQSLIALSSAESQLYGIAKSASHAFGICSVLQDLGVCLHMSSFATLVQSWVSFGAKGSAE